MKKNEINKMMKQAKIDYPEDNPLRHYNCLICGKEIGETTAWLTAAVCDECKEAIQYVKDNFPVHRTEDDPVVIGHSSDEKNFILHLSDGRTVSVPVDAPLIIMSENK